MQVIWHDMACNGTVTALPVGQAFTLFGSFGWDRGPEQALNGKLAD
jgi:hypothetical protein